MNTLTEQKTQVIRTIVLTGGPCGGKSTCESRVINYFSKLGWTVLYIRETATEMMGAGYYPHMPKRNGLDFQSMILGYQLKREDCYRLMAETLPDEKVLILCDRGALDNKGYCDKEIWDTALLENAIKEEDINNRYDGVVHLRSVADTYPEIYVKEVNNNPARYEKTPEEAVATDKRTEIAWLGARVFYIGNDGTFEEKIQKAITAIAGLLGEPAPLEIEEKFLLTFFNPLDFIPSSHRAFQITQFYLTQKGAKVEVRVRRMKSLTNGAINYSKTHKVGNGKVREETEELIYEDTYNRLIAEGLSELGHLDRIEKTRYVFVDNNIRYELDQYHNVDFLKGYLTLEVEQAHEDEKTKLPEWLMPFLVRDVTEEKEYKNRALAK